MKSSNEFKLALETINELAYKVEDGYIDPFLAAKELKELGDLINQHFELIKTKCIDTLSVMAEKSYERYGIVFSLRNKTNYSFEHIPLIKNAENQLKMIENHIKGLKEIAKKGGGINPDTGEMIEAAKKEDNGYTLVMTKSKK